MAPLPPKRQENLRKTSPLEYEVRVTRTPTFDRAAVNAYKLKKIFLLQNSPQIRRFLLREKLTYVAAILLLGACAWLCTFLPWQAHLFLALAGTVAIFGATSMAELFLLTSLLGDIPNKHTHAEWLESDYYEFTSSDPAPQAVADTVAELQARLPNAKFIVEHLYKDPFVRAEHINRRNGKKESIVIGFWDENGFVH
jgi:hypothetical protein